MVPRTLVMAGPPVTGVMEKGAGQLAPGFGVQGPVEQVSAA